jgi:hypothetical protein
MPTALKHSLRKLHALFCIIIARFMRFCRLPNRHANPARKPLKLVLLISRPQDIDLFIDIHRHARTRSDLKVSFWATKRALTHFPATGTLLAAAGIQPSFHLSHGNLIAATFKLLEVDAFLNTVESTVARHKVPYLITTIANAGGVHTYTMQHGFENVGLTYHDPELGPLVRFAAQNVLTWGPVDRLPGTVAPETRRKCLAVGSPKVHLTRSDQPRETTGTTDHPPIIAVFEGLHADRFDDRYLRLFFADLQHLADTFTDLRFILKPHPGIVKRTGIHTEFLHSLRGVEVLDPARRESTTWSTPKLLTQALAVITTPSTIALDAAMVAAPVAVTRYGQQISYYDYYEPLPLIDAARDSENFINLALTDQAHLQNLSRSFLERVCMPGNAAERILDIVSGHAAKHLSQTS